jgi:sugar phosphate isomerase/epimerase
MNKNRRDFLYYTSSAAAAMLLSPFETITLPEKPLFKEKAGFRLLIMNTNWGYKGDWSQFCAVTKKEGYDGIEVWFPDEATEQQELFAALKNNGLQVGFLCAGSEPDPLLHLQTFKKKLDIIVSNKYQQPVYINCHSGRDYFTYEQNKLIIDHTTQISRATGLPIYHETHRSRMLFAAHITRHFIEQNPDLRLTLDISHWCNVHESLLNDQQQTVEIALQRVGHIHARIGHAEGPQVNDPRAPEWENAVKAHLGWWDKVIERKKQKGEQMTMLTEFGPPDYMPTLPYSRQPLADQWAINVHMMKLLRSRYQ